MGAKRKVCMTGPTGLTVVADALRQAGCELVLGKPLDDFREFRYERKDLVKLIGDAPIVFPAGRDFIGADILDSCPDLAGRGEIEHRHRDRRCRCRDRFGHYLLQQPDAGKLHGRGRGDRRVDGGAVQALEAQ